MKKGFTLIELLAVILILGIIALIAIPQVTRIIKDAEEGAIRRSAEEYIKSVETYVTIKEMTGETLPSNIDVDTITPDLNLKGDVPSSGNIVISNGEVISCMLLYDEYKYNCDGTLVSLSDNIDIELVVDNNSNGIMDTGDKVCIDTECFYVISNSNGTVRALAEWNLNVGFDYSWMNSSVTSYSSTYKAFMHAEEYYTVLNPTAIKQDSTKKGFIDNVEIYGGVISFAPANAAYVSGYWNNNGYILEKYVSGVGYPIYVYDENSNLYSYINTYVSNLNMLTGKVMTGDLISQEELISLGCVSSVVGSCVDSGYSWIYSTSYWTGSASGSNVVSSVDARGQFMASSFDYPDLYGVRPVITFSVSNN